MLISRDDSRLVSKFSVTDIGLCDNNGIIVNDHYTLTLEINETFEKSSYKTISYKKLIDINVETFKHDIRDSASLNSTNGSANQLAMNYVNGLNMLINTHAPVIQTTLIPRPNAALYNQDVRNAKQLRCKLERVWRCSKEDDRVFYRNQCTVVARSIFNAKSAYYSSKVLKCDNNVKALSQITDKLLKNNHQICF